MFLTSLVLQHLHSCGTEGRKYPLGPDRLFTNTVLQGLCVGKVFTEIQQPASQTWAPKIRCLWLYLLTYLWDFLQVWSACKDKAAALNKGLSSLQSLAPEQRTEKTFSLGAGGHWMAPKPCADLLSFLLIGGRAPSPCTGQENCFSGAVLAAQSTPAKKDQRGRGEFVSPLRCRVLCLCRCLCLSETHAQVSHLLFHLSFIWWDESRLKKKTCGLGLALRLA